MKYLTLLLLVVIPPANISAQTARTVIYHLTVQDTIVNFTGKIKHAIAINGQLPAPTLFFTEGDTAEILVHNKMKHETSIHWHGLLLPNEMDGVPVLNTTPIESGGTHHFSFPLIQSGTYWYHSHTMLQEQSGLYGAFVIRKRNNPQPENEEVVLLSDWTNEKPMEVMRSLKRETDWYAIQKRSVQSYGKALTHGAFGARVKQDWHRMPPMDISDVYYHAVLTNGRKEQSRPQYKPGDKVRLRVVNGAASSYFYMQWAGGKMNVVAADGIDVEPVETDKLMIAIAESYDIELTIPEGNMSWEFRATTQDVTRSTSLWLGEGMLMKAPEIPPVNYFGMMKMMGKSKKMEMPEQAIRHEMQMDHGDTSKTMQMDHGHHMPETGKGQVLDYGQLRAVESTTLDTNREMREIHLDLTGNMLRYVWAFDGKTLSQSDRILIQKGENVRMVLHNKTMMNHPMHLHGHFFRLVNGQGDRSPLKHTFNIAPMETVTIEFEANEEKDWFFHCHILYHMMSGMARIVSYDTVAAMPKAYKPLKKEDRRMYPFGQLSAHSQGVWGNITLSGTRYAFNVEGRGSYKGDYETETHLLRYFGKKQFFSLYAGSDWRRNASLRDAGESNTKNDRQVFCVGAQYLLPMLLLADLRFDHTGKVRFQVSREDLALTTRLRVGGRWNTDMEWTVNMSYVLAKNLSLSANYDSDYGLGGGLTLIY